MSLPDPSSIPASVRGSAQCSGRGVRPATAPSDRAIERAGDVSASLAWSGIRVSLITTAFGLIVLAVAMLAWLALRTARHRAAER